jgi:hypothetical protein
LVKEKSVHVTGTLISRSRLEGREAKEDKTARSSWTPNLRPTYWALMIQCLTAGTLVSDPNREWVQTGFFLEMGSPGLCINWCTRLFIKTQGLEYRIITKNYRLFAQQQKWVQTVCTAAEQHIQRMVV